VEDVVLIRYANANAQDELNLYTTL